MHYRFFLLRIYIFCKNTEIIYASIIILVFQSHD